ncbi:MAG: hypothetical protein EOO27_17315 [Comamonadaceae bacterium]|nr:MAG: hypothetical protein EOO27_17315 [Comamonadaceae bacterium]
MHDDPHPEVGKFRDVLVWDNRSVLDAVAGHGPDVVQRSDQQHERIDGDSMGSNGSSRSVALFDDRCQGVEVG